MENTMGTAFLGNGDNVYYSSLIPTGGASNNYIYGQGGNDYIIGNGYSDIIDGGTGNDTIGGDGGVDVIYGKDGDDQLFGGDGNDLVYGGDDNDLVYGDNGSDTLYGEDGNDTLYGGAGADHLYGGAGNDAYLSNIGDSGIDTISEYALGDPAYNSAGGGGVDYIKFFDITGSQIAVASDGVSLYVTSNDDLLDGVVDSGVKIFDFFSGGNHVIEYAFGSDGAGVNLTAYL